MPGKISFIQHNITSLFPGKTPFQEGSFMKIRYFLALALLLMVITPVATDMYCYMNNRMVPVGGRC